ncbi:MAG TPA: antitoxin [Microlunatus sp.]
MGIFDKAKDLLGDNKDKVQEGIDKAADVIDEKTGGDHIDKIEQGAEMAKDKADELLNDNK